MMPKAAGIAGHIWPPGLLFNEMQNYDKNGRIGVPFQWFTKRDHDRRRSLPGVFFSSSCSTGVLRFRQEGRSRRTPSFFFSGS